MKLTREALREELEKCPRPFVEVFAYRCGLRVLPLLGRDGNFKFWKGTKRKRHIFSVLRVYDVVEAKLVGVGGIVSAIVAADAAYAAYANAAYANATYAADAAHVAYANAAANAATDVAYAAYAAYAAAHFTQLGELIKTQIQSDLKQSTLPAAQFLHKPLWDTPSKEWNTLSNTFKNALDNIGFSYWAEVYEDRINGKTDLAALKTRVSLSKEILNQSPDEITSYLLSLAQQGSQRLNEVKVVFLGDGGAGKTSLLHKIINPNAQLEAEEAPTPGVDIHQWQPKGTPCQAHLWDFGGQVILHATHQFFMTQRSLYVIVLDGRKEQDPNYWLHHTKTFGGDSPVLLVINKIDQHDGDVERNTLKTKYPNICGFYAISCKDNQGVAEFTAALRARLVQPSSWQAEFPSDWFALKTALQKCNDDFISLEKYKEICTEFTITGPDQKSLLTYLNDLGIMIYFSQLAHFNTHVLNPRWLTEAVYKIINSEELKSSKGMLLFTELSTILAKQKPSDYYYPEEKYAFIMEMMQEFELCYKLESKTLATAQYLIPDLLEKDQPSPLDFDKTKSLRFRFYFAFLPRSIIARFIVNMAQDIKGQCRWRYGVVLENITTEGCALVIADHDARTIDIWVKGEQARAYFSVLRNLLHTIFNSYKHFEFTEQVPLDEAETEFENYQQLLGLERMGESFYISGKLRKKFALQRLLDNFEPPTIRQENTLRDNAMRPHPVNIPNIYVDASTQVNVQINIEIKNQAIQEFKGIFQVLKEDALLETTNPTEKKKLAEELNHVEQAINDIATAQTPEALATSSAIERLKSWLGKLDKANSRIGKAIKVVEQGADLANKLIKNYNKIAGLCGWLPMPEIKLKSE